MISDSLQGLLDDMRTDIGENLILSDIPHERTAARLIFTPAMEEILTFIEAESERVDGTPVNVVKAMEFFVLLLLMTTAKLTASNDLAPQVALRSASNVNIRCQALVADLTKVAKKEARHAD